MLKSEWEEFMDTVEEGDVVDVLPLTGHKVTGKIAYLGYAGIILENGDEYMLENIASIKRFDEVVLPAPKLIMSTPVKHETHYTGSVRPTRGKYFTACQAHLCLHIRGLSGQGRVYSGPLECYY